MSSQRKTKKTVASMWELSRYGIFILVIFALIIIAVLGYSLLEMKQVSIDTATRYVQGLTKQLTKMIDLEIGHRRQQLISVGDSFEQVVTKKDDAAVEEFVTRKQSLYGYDFIALEDIANGRIATAGTIPDDFPNGVEDLRSLDMSRNTYKEKTCHVDIVDENLLYAIPLLDSNDKPIGILWAGNTTESMQNIIRSRSFQERSYTCIINRDGDPILTADKQEEFLNLASIYQQDSNEELRKDTEEMQENIKNNKSGIFSFTTEDGHPVHLSYTPMLNDEWIMLTIIPTNLLSTEYDRFVYMAAAAVAGTLLVFIGFLIILTRVYRSNRKKLEQLAFTDEVTGGSNNQAFYLKYRALGRKTDTRKYTLAQIDVVNFKEVNKEYGFDQGNATLRYLYNVINSQLDEDQGEFVARSEMDRFFLCLRERDPEQVQQRLDAIIEKINAFEDTAISHHPLFFRMAAVSIKDRHADPLELQDQVRSVLKRMDPAPGKCVFYSKEFADYLLKEQELNNAFESALLNDEFLVYFQPKVSLGKGAVEGAEALVRWHHPQRGLVPPGEFIPMLESNGKIQYLDKYVFEKVCIWLKKRQDAGNPMFPVSVNLSRNYLMDDNFFAWFVETADKYDVPHELIEFELTETTFMMQSQIQQMRAYIQRLHELGFRLSIDDFGTGYSAISLLREFDVDVLKLDRTFFLDLEDHRARDVISCLVRLSEKLNIHVVVEGIETKKQIEYLRELNCDVVQGYFFSKPLPEQEFNEWYRTFDFAAFGA